MKRFPAQTDTFYSVNELAYLYHVHPLTIRRYIKSGRLKAIRIGGNVRIKESDLGEFNQIIAPQAENLHVKEKKSESKIFFRDDPFFQLHAKGASIK